MADNITALATLVAALGALVVAIMNARTASAVRDKALLAAAAAVTAKEAAEESKREIIATKEGVFEVGKRIDGRLSELLTLTETSAHAAGVLEGRREGRGNENTPTQQSS